MALSDSQDIPHGYCQCGCGEKTNLARRTNPKYGHIKGQPVRFRRGHRRTPPEQERFWNKVDKGDGCWIWTGYVKDNGYGQFSIRDGDKTVPLYAHRYAYQAVKGEIAEGLHLDHLCRNRVCVNPSHLEAVTPRENLLRGETLAAANSAKTHCAHGHEYTPENTKIKKGGRCCRACERHHARLRYRRLKA